MKISDKCLGFMTGCIFFLFGHNPTTLKVVYCFMFAIIFDIITGIVSSLYQGNKFDYRIFGKGIVKKLMMLLCVTFGYYLDSFNVFKTNGNLSFEIGIASSFVVTEILSILNNFKVFGLSIPFIEKYIKID